MLDCAKISHLLPFSGRKKVVLCIPNLRFAVFLVLLLFAVTAPVLGEDLNPPDFAGALQTGAIFWEFSEDSDQPTSHFYLLPLVEPKFGYRFYWDAWQWQSGAGIDGDGAMLLVEEDSLVQPIPDGDGDFLTVYFQITWSGTPDPENHIGIGLEVWADLLGWTPGEEFEEEHLDGAEFLGPIEEYDLGGGWTQSTFEASFWSWEVDYVHIILHMDIENDLLIDEAVVDMVLHDDFPPPVGPGRPGQPVEILGNWEDESSDLSRPQEAGSDRALIFTAHTENNTGVDMNLTSVTYGGQAMTKVIDRNVADSVLRAYVAAFILDEADIAAASGGTFEVTWAQTPSNTPAYSSVFLSNVYQGDLVGASDSAVVLWTNTVATSPLTTNEGDMVIVAATAGNNGGYQVDNGFTEAVELAPSGADGIAGYKSATGADETAQVTLSGANRQAIIGFVVQRPYPDSTAPEPDPMTWAAVPHATGRNSIDMTAATASDPSGVRYYFNETSGNPGGNDSSWQFSTSYSDTGLTADTQYTYRVKAQDISVNWNETAWSDPCSATTDPPDIAPPIPDPALWASEPMALGPFSIGMMAAEATDESGVQYYFEETSGKEGGSDSGWQSSRSYTDHSLAPLIQYTYRVKARDLSPQFNETDWSALRSATTDEAPSLGCPVGDLDHDCDCDMDDVRIFAGQWLAEAGCADHPADCADLNEQDGVDGVDFAILAADWYKKGANLVINEMMADNDTTIQDEHDEWNDWIEIFNPTGETIDMGGMYLQDNQPNPTTWEIPSGTTIAPGEYKLFWADEETWQGNNHTNFGLSRNGDGVTLYDTDGVTPIDSKSFSEMREDVSYGRYEDAADSWYDMPDPTPGLPNIMGMATGVYFSRPGGTFTSSFSLSLTTKSPTATIYYTTNGDEPTDTVSSTNFEYTGPITIYETIWLRARAYDVDIEMQPSPIASRTYIRLDADVQSFQSNLPIIIIDSFGWDIDYEGRDFHPVMAAFIDTDEVTGTCAITDSADWTGYGGMHIRGQSTTDYEKKQYRFETWDENTPDPDPKARYRDTDVSLLGFPADSDWIIHGPYSDRTLMRNYQMYTWSGQIGRYAVRCRFVEVFLDFDSEFDPGSGRIEWDGGWEWSETDYRGVYVFMEKIKRDRNRLDIGGLDPSDNAEPEITGGYVFEKGGDDPGFETTTYWDYLSYFDPEWDELTATQRNWIENHFNEFESGLAGPNFDNPLHPDYYGNYIDIGSFIDHHILVETSKNVDGFLISTFLYKERNGKINMGPIWDYNGSLGGGDYFCSWDPVGWHYEFDETQCIDQLECTHGEWDVTFPFDPWEFIPRYEWYWRLFEDSEFLLKYADRYFELREYDFKTANMHADIDNNAAVLTTNVAGTTPVGRNFTRWDIFWWDIWPDYLDNILWDFPDCQHGYPLTFAGHVDWVKDWLAARLTWMDIEIDVSYGDAPPVIKVNSVNKNRGEHITSGDSISMTGGGSIYYTTDGTDPRGYGGTTLGTLYGSSFTLSESAQIKARIRYTASNWSALNEATFAVGPVAENLRITEIMYHVDDPNHEYIELKNISGSATIQLNLVKFTDGIDFTFPSISVGPGDYVVVARNQADFVAKYPGVPIGKIAGEFIRSQQRRRKD
ncbi:MAG: CotH kinase family protein [Planctomycetota bacterium]|jgi:hypothetical protein